MIKVEHLSKTFGKFTAVNDISFRVRQGEIFGLVGPDGAGKTTAIRMLIGILEKSAGTVNVLDKSNPEEFKAEIGYVPQKFSLYGDLTVMENIEFIGSLYGASKQTIHSLANEILGFTKLLPFRDRLADNLSGGMKQKLALAAGLMHKPKIYFLDEPTTGVDPVSRREFWQMLYRLNKQGTTVFVSTPYMDEAELCSRVAFMHEGKIVSTGSPADLKAQYPYKILELSADSKQVKALLESKVLDINAFGDTYHLVVNDVEPAEALVRESLMAAGVTVHFIRHVPPTLEDVFVHLASEVA